MDEEFEDFVTRAREAKSSRDRWKLGDIAQELYEKSSQGPLQVNTLAWAIGLKAETLESYRITSKAWFPHERGEHDVSWTVYQDLASHKGWIRDGLTTHEARAIIRRNGFAIPEGACPPLLDSSQLTLLKRVEEMLASLIRTYSDLPEKHQKKLESLLRANLDQLEKKKEEDEIPDHTPA